MTVATAFIASGAAGTRVLDEPGGAVVLGYYPPGVDPHQRAVSAMASLPGIQPRADPETRPCPDQCWEAAWRDQFQPVRVRDRWSVQAPWHGPAPGYRVIEIEPGMAFGTGLHVTTQMCLDWMATAPLDGKAVVDVGTGSGVLAIAACTAGAATVVAIDCDPVALRSARRNVARNGVAGRVHLIQGRNLAGLRLDSAVVLANLTTSGVSVLAAELRDRQSPGGTLVASGIASEKAGDVESRLRSLGYHICLRRDVRNWTSLAAILPP
jgi:ribosomal protein L11 methyltransferase